MKEGTHSSLLASLPARGETDPGVGARDLSATIRSAWKGKASKGFLERGLLAQGFEGLVGVRKGHRAGAVGLPQFVPWPFYHSRLVMVGGGGGAGRVGERGKERKEESTLT